MNSVDRYAHDVLEGKIPAGRMVRLACERHEKDGKRKDLKWDQKAAARALGFFNQVLRLASGQFEGHPFILQPWQAFIIGSLFGWKFRNSLRRYQIAYIEIGKGNGKSPLAAGIGLYMLVADGEARAEVYSAATKLSQAMILFRHAVAMRDQSPHLSDRLTKSGIGEKAWNLAYLKTGSFFRPISSEDKGQSGPLPHCALIDELHEHRSPIVVDIMRAGLKGRRQPLVFEITNSGYDRNSVCWEHHEYSRAVLEGQMENDRWFAYVCQLDPCQKCEEAGERQPKDGCRKCDQWDDEKVWPKANPNLGISIQRDYLRDRVREAKAMPSTENTVKRLNFCLWTQQASRYIPMNHWDDCAAPVEIESLRGRTCFAGIDLSTTEDLTGLTLGFKPRKEGEPWKVLAYGWIPEENLKERMERHRVPYDQWIKAGYVQATPGNVVDYKLIRAKILALNDVFRFQKIGFDPRNATHFALELRDDYGFDVLFVQQGYVSLSAPTKELLRLVMSHQLAHGGNPLLRWNADNLVVQTDHAMNVRPAKDKATAKIDVIVSMIIMLAAAIGEPEKRSIYEERGVLRV